MGRIPSGISAALLMLSCTSSPASPEKTSIVAPAPAASRPAGGPEPVFVLVHKWARGAPTVVRVHRDGGDYRLVSVRTLMGDCSLSARRVIAAKDAGALVSSMEILDPGRLAEDNACHTSIRDGSYWSIGARIDDKWQWRSVQQDGPDDPLCRELEAAARQIMAVMDLSCTGVACFTEQDRARKFRCP